MCEKQESKMPWLITARHLRPRFEFSQEQEKGGEQQWTEIESDNK